MQLAPSKNGHLTRAVRSRTPALRQLGWPHYWLLVSILGSGLVFFVLILLMTFPQR